MNIKEYKKMLKEHDWFYIMSDDNRVYLAGLQQDRKLKELQKRGKTYVKAYADMERKVFKK